MEVVQSGDWKWFCNQASWQRSDMTVHAASAGGYNALVFHLEALYKVAAYGLRLLILTQVGGLSLRSGILRTFLDMRSHV